MSEAPFKPGVSKGEESGAPSVKRDLQAAYSWEGMAGTCVSWNASFTRVRGAQGDDTT